jgi:hypothetical protein
LKKKKQPTLITQKREESSNPTSLGAKSEEERESGLNKLQGKEAL